MKKLLSAFLIVCVQSCAQPQKEETAVANFVQTSGNVKTDLSFRLKELKFILNILGRDSVEFYVDRFNKDYSEPMTASDFIKLYTKSSSRYAQYIKEYSRQLDSVRTTGKNSKISDLNRAFNWQIEEDYVKSIANFQKDLDRANFRLNTLKRYQPDSESVITKKYQVVYIVKNPMLGNVEQEITRVFYLSPDGTKVISSE